MRTTIDLPDDLIRAAKARAAERGESLKELFTRAIVGELGGPPKALRMGKVALPLVGRGAEPTITMTNVDIESALAADDSERYGNR
jgi:hypothetical protein